MIGSYRLLTKSLNLSHHQYLYLADAKKEEKGRRELLLYLHLINVRY